MKRLLLTMFMVAALLGVVFAPASIVMAASANRSLPSSVTAGANFNVDINTPNYGAFGQVVETLPVGFSYVSSTLSAAAVTPDGQVVKFTLLGETTFSYTVKASSTAGTYTFSGILKNEDKVQYDVGGQTQITVPATASRVLPSSVTAGANFNVDINTPNYGAFGQVVETLPVGFSYVSSSLSVAAVTVNGQEVKFTLLGETTFSYTVKASSTAGTYTFSGILKDEDKVQYDVGGQTQITVPAPSPPPVGAPTYYTQTNLFGVEKSYRISSQGKILSTIEATSEDGNLTITIPEGTITLDKDGDRLDSLEAAVDESPPSPPKDAHIIGLAYDFGPDGATFDPPITLEYSYDPEALPEGVAEEDLVLAYYDEATSGWVELDCVVDTENNTITASVAHFTTFAIIGTVTPPTPPAPAAFSVSSLSVLPAEVEPGETVTIAVLVANTGGEAGSYQVTLVINDLVEATKEVTVRAGLSKEVTFSVTREEAGSYAVTVAGLSDSFTVVPVVVPPEPAAFSVSLLSVSPEVEPGETVTITVLVANTGGESGSYTVVLKIDGVKEDEERVTVAAGESQDVSFSVSREEADTYAVTVDGLSGSFTVVAPVVVPPAEPGINWALNGGLIAAVIVVGLGVFFWWRRRAY